MKPTRISKRFQLTADPMNIILQEKFTNKKQDTTGWKNIAYFSTPEGALNHIIEAKIKEYWVGDLREVVKAMDELKEIIRAINPKALPQPVQAILSEV